MQARHQVDGNSITPCDAHSTASTRRHRPKERRANACFTLCILACNTTSPKTAKGQRRPFVGFYSRMIDDWNTFCLRWSDRLCLSCGIVTAIAAIYRRHYERRLVGGWLRAVRFYQHSFA